MERIIGAVLAAARIKKYTVQYKLLFSDSRVIALQTGEDARQFGQVYIPQAGVTANAELGITSGLEMGKREAKIMMAWVDRVRDINKNRRNIVSYGEASPPEPLDPKSVVVPYNKIRTVTTRMATREGADQEKAQAEISFGTGILSSESFVIPATSTGAVMELIGKTPLGDRIKSPTPIT